MGTVSHLVTPKALDAAWEEYALLVRQAQADPKLAADRQHVEATFRAHRRFFDLFSASEAA